MRLVPGIATAAVMLLTVLFATSEKKKTVPTRQWVKIVFGTDGKVAKWDGRVQATKGTITNLAPWSFEKRDSMGSSSWKITTGIPDAKRVTYAESERGVLVEIDSSMSTTLEIKTRQGNFQIQPKKMKAGHPVQMLDGRATVELLGSGDVVATTTTDDDFPAIAIDGDGHRHVTWIAFDEKKQRNHLLVRDVDDPQSRTVAISQVKEAAHLKMLSGPGGVLYAVWCSPDNNGNWEIYFAKNQKRGWLTKQVTHTKGADCQVAAAITPSGALWLAWQSTRNGNNDIYAQRFFRSEWLADDIVVAAQRSNQWQPSITVDSKGKAWIGYDSYENGNYDVFVKTVEITHNKAVVSQQIPIATSRDFEAHASVQMDAKDRLWVAYDAAGPRWGKDFRNTSTMLKGKYGEPLHASRRLELRCLVNGKLHKIDEALPQILPPRPIRKIDRKPNAKPSRFYEYPQLALDGNGRLWLFYRMNRQGYCPHPPNGIDWKIYATTRTDKGWLHPVELPQSQGRQNQRVAFAVGKDKNLCCAWASGCRFASVNRKYVAYHGRLPQIEDAIADIPLTPTEPGKPGNAIRSQVPAWKITRGKQSFEILFGDLHRHTSISRCSPTIDGCLTDAHRYAMDAAELDFLAVTDHTRDVDLFSWWRTQQAVDLYHIPKKYLPIYAYERSNQNPTGGHRNVFFLERGWEINRSDHWYLGRGLKTKETQPDTTLYPWMKKQGVALTAAHTPAYVPKSKKGTWTYHDPQVEPVAEIYQSYRRSYERPGKGVREEATLWHALKKGHRLGFIASSDHMATHTSYACVWVTERTRKGIFAALQARRTYGATDRILLEHRIGDALMGEGMKHTGKQVKMTIRAKGTARITEVQIIRSGKVLATLTPGRQNIEIEHIDPQPLPGESYYYVRVTQIDGERAWGSPIHVQR